MRWLILSVLGLLPLMSTAQQLVEFENSTVADAEDINANFETLKSRIDQTDGIFGLSCPEGTFVTGISLSKDLTCSRDTGSASLDLAYTSSYGAIDLSAAGNAIAISHFSDGSVQNAVMVFDRESASEWSQRGETLYIDVYGSEARISGIGNTVAVGDAMAASARGKAFVWHWQDNEWTQRGSSFVGGTSADRMRGPALNYAGDVFAIDEFQYASAREGRVRTFIWDGSEWQVDFSQVGGVGERIQYPTLNSTGDIVAYGSSLTTGSDSTADGFVKVFQKVNSDWIQKGEDISFSTSNREFRPALNSAGDKLLLITSDASGERVCHAYVAEWSSSDASWSVSGPIRFGSFSPGNIISCRGKLSGDGTTIILGNAEASPGGYSNAGSVYVLRRSGSQWVNILEYSGTAENERLGSRLAISEDGNTFAYSRLGTVEIVSH